MAIKLADTARPNNHVDAEHLGTFPVAYAEDVWFSDGTRLSEKTFDGQSIQVTELPLASATEVGHVYQYIGASGTYEHDCFYECVANGNNYTWVISDVVKNPVSYMGTPPSYSGDGAADGKVIVYSGEDANGFLKGHHYRWSEDFTAEVHEMKCWNEAHSSYVQMYIADDVVNVGTRLYTRNGDTYWCQAGVVSIDGDNLTIYSVAGGTFIAYGYEIVENSATVTIEYSWEDIGGGGSAGGSDYEEFVGTQAEWDALSQSQKNKYDGKIVNITDDEGGIDSFYPSAPTTPTVVFEKSNQSSNIDSTYTVDKKAFYIVRVHTYSEVQSHAAQVFLNGVQIGTESSYSATSGVGYTVTIPCNIGDTIRMIVTCGGSGTYDKRHAVIYRLD